MNDELRWQKTKDFDAPDDYEEQAGEWCDYFGFNDECDELSFWGRVQKLADGGSFTSTQMQRDVIDELFRRLIKTRRKCDRYIEDYEHLTKPAIQDMKEKIESLKKERDQWARKAVKLQDIKDTDD